jgi:hypothetical protein
MPEQFLLQIANQETYYLVVVGGGSVWGRLEIKLTLEFVAQVSVWISLIGAGEAGPAFEGKM